VLNTHYPQDPGTTVAGSATGDRRPTTDGRRTTDDGAVKAIACKKEINVLNIVSTRMLLAHGFLSRLFQVFAEHRIVVDVLSSSEVSVSLTIDRGDRLAKAMQDLRRFADVQLRTERALVCLVGSGLARMPGVAGRVFSTLGREGINIEMISQGASDVNLSLVVKNPVADRCVRILHRELFGQGERNAECRLQKSKVKT